MMDRQHTGVEMTFQNYVENQDQWKHLGRRTNTYYKGNYYTAVSGICSYMYPCLER
jgi:hypothetical protein